MIEASYCPQCVLKITEVYHGAVDVQSVPLQMLLLNERLDYTNISEFVILMKHLVILCHLYLQQSD